MPGLILPRYHRLGPRLRIIYHRQRPHKPRHLLRQRSHHFRGYPDTERTRHTTSSLQVFASM
jgi:hypothetical protein